MPLPKFNTKGMLDFLVNLLNIPSPTGFTENAIAFIEETLADYPDLTLTRTSKGSLVVKWPGDSERWPRALSAHVDTLGGMVKVIKPNGRLQLTRIGGLLLNGVETEGCWVITQSGEKIRGSYLINKASGHVYGAESNEMKRSEESMEVRLDARTSSAEETRELGIEVGDFVAFDPRVEVRNGFIRSRFLDDKAGVAALVSAMQLMTAAGLKPARTSYFLFSNFEEVGHGAPAGIPAEVTELVAVDMAAIGAGQESDEFHATICVKDSSGPYHHGLSNRLRKLAAAHHIPHKVDIYPYYGSDGSAALRAGRDLAVALLGPGIDASHNYERTHTDALSATTQWVMAYLLSE
ncbi:MAG: M42 family metallopeptidase [Anaerolineales bacterium]|nr:M42 family metallopeptidase [Anaerolineales bacterium]